MFGLVRTDGLPVRQGTAREPRRWDPWSEMERARAEMDELAARALGFTPLNRILEAPALPVELYEDADQYTLRAHLPGVSREDINLEVTESHVALWGERRAPTPPEGTKVHASTATYGRFRFEYELPVAIKADGVAATYRDGILEILLPKVEVSRPAPVKVEIQG